MLASQEYLLANFNLPINTLELSDASSLLQSCPVSPLSPCCILSETNLANSVVKSLKECVSIIQRIDRKHGIIFQPKNYNEEITEKLVKLVTSLKILQLHFEFILEVLRTSIDEEIMEISFKYDPISKRYNGISKKSEICLVAIYESFGIVIFPLLKEVEKVTDNFFISNDDGQTEIIADEEVLDCVQIATSKIDTTLEYFPEAATIKPDDIFAQKRSSDVWKDLYKDSEFVTLADKETIKDRFKVLYRFLKVFNAMIYKSQQCDSKNLKDRLLTAVSGFYYGAKVKEAEIKSSLYLSNPKMDSAFQVWNLPEQAWVKEIMKLALPTIDYDKKIYIPRLFPLITRETILKEYEDGTLNRITESTLSPKDLSSRKESILESIFTKKTDAVKIRIISAYPLVLKGTNSEKAKAMAMEAVNKVNQFLKPGKPKINMEIDEIIIHIHGGGFVAGSSSSHRNYLYRWAKNLKRVIFSVDYRLAPANPYPAGLDDVWQAYNWILNYAEAILGIKTNKIVLAGDSAGGNLVMALTLRAIKMGIRVPDGCLLVYPALCLYPKNFVPSYFLAIEDSMLPYSMLKLCIKAYISEEFKPEQDPFLSPLVASDELMAKLPPIRIATGTNDPLHDDNWRFLNRMQKLSKDIKVTVYENMPHAFLSFDQIDEYKFILEGTCKMLKDLFCNQKSADSEQREKGSP